MGKIGKLARTVKHLRGKQIVYQVLNRISKKNYRLISAPDFNPVAKTNWIEKNKSLKENQSFEFLNITKTFDNWDDTRQGMLWTYNLNYMDWLCQPKITEKTTVEWIDKFIKALSDSSIGLDPYPIALRSINWIKAFTRFPNSATRVRIDSLYAQIKLLANRPEYHLMANHLLEDAFALYIAGNAFDDNQLLGKAKRLLLRELKEQILPDGAHYEQSPMYHSILLDRLLDCINFDKSDSVELKQYASRMLGHLESISWQNHEIPMLNDSAQRIAPTTEELFEYAGRLGIKWQPIEMHECGYRKFTGNGIEAVIDIGNITASYQPGHTHADTFNYELRNNGKPFIVDTGISTYEKNARRQYERSTPAHNTVSVDNRDSSEIWGGFRVGRRNKVSILKENKELIHVEHNGFGNNCTHTRIFELTPHGFRITDRLSNTNCGISFLHLSPEVTILKSDNQQIKTSAGTILIDGASRVEVCEDFVACQYNRLQKTHILKLFFKKNLTYTIK